MNILATNRICLALSLAMALTLWRVTPSIASSNDEIDRAVARLQELGAVIRRDASLPKHPVIAVEFRMAQLVQRQDQLVDPFSVRVAPIKVGSDVIADIVLLKDLKELNLSGTAVTDGGLKTLGAMRSLRRLELDRTSITDAGLDAIANLDLNYLSVNDTKLTDASIEKLVNMKSIKILSVEGTGISENGLALLRKKMPRTKIIMSPDDIILGD